MNSPKRPDSTVIIIGPGTLRFDCKYNFLYLLNIQIQPGMTLVESNRTLTSNHSLFHRQQAVLQNT